MIDALLLAALLIAAGLAAHWRRMAQQARVRARRAAMRAHWRRAARGDGLPPKVKAFVEGL